MVRHWFTTYLTQFYSQNTSLGLDVGCGKKPYIDFFQCEYIGIDLPKKNSNDFYPDVFSSAENLPFKNNQFDFLTCYSVIPYIENIEKFLNEINRVCKNNAIAVIIIMNLKALSKDPDGYYPNRLSSRELTKIFENHGFKSIKSKNLKTLFWSTYFNLTSVYSYAILKCNKKNSEEN